MRKLITISILALFVLTQPIYAVTYYASNAATNGYAVGNDANTTTQAQSKATPWLTIAGAEAKSSNGDIVYVNGGTYAEASNVVFSKGIAWIADGVPIVTNTTTNSYAGSFLGNSNVCSITGFTFDGTGKANGFRIYTLANNKSFINCTITCDNNYDILISGTSDAITLTGNTFNGTPVTAGIVGSGAVTNFTASGNTHNYSSQHGYYFVADTGNISITNEIWNATITNAVIDLLGAGTITITRHTGTIAGAGARFFNASTAAQNGAITISNNTLTFTGATGTNCIGITNGAHAVTISNNTIVKSSSTDAYAFVNVTNQAIPILSGNTFTAANTNSATLTGILVLSTGTTVGAAQVINNTITTTQTAKQLILIGSDTSGAGNNKIDGAIITGNRLYASLGAGSVHCIEFGYNKDGIITGNYVYGGGYGIVVKGNANDYTTGKVAYNILKDQSLEQVLIKGQHDVPVYNNTFYISASRTISTGSLSMRINADSANVPATGAIVKNNLFYTQPSQVHLVADADSSVGLVVNYNLYWDGTGIRNTAGGTTYTNWTTWKAAGYDANSPSPADPLLISSSDFRLRNTSTGIDAGTDLSLLHDYTGNHIHGNPDLGAYEYPFAIKSIAGVDSVLIGYVSQQSLANSVRFAGITLLY